MKRPLPTAAEVAEILGRRRSRPPHRPPPPVGRSLRPFLKALDARFGQGPQALAARWPEIVGAEVARRTEPVKLVKPRGGGPASLELRVAPGAALMIQHEAQALLGRVNLYLGAGSVDRLRIVQGRVKVRPEPQSRPSPRWTRPLDAAAEAALAAEVATVPDDRLRAALLKLGRGVRSAGGRGGRPRSDPS